MNKKPKVTGKKFPVKERDKKGRFSKGHKGGPGRPKGEPRDIICKDGKKRSVNALIDDLLATYGTLGGTKFLKKWAMQSHGNLRKFIEILFKFAPQPDVVAGDTNIQIISAVPRIRSDDTGQGERIKELQQLLRQRDEEIRLLKGQVDVPDLGDIKHEPVRPAELPEHSMEAGLINQAPKKVSVLKKDPAGSWPEFRGLNDEKLERKLERLPEDKMLELYKKLEREMNLRIDPENYKRHKIVKNFLLLWTRKKDDERRKAAQGEELLPLTEEEENKIFSKGSGIAGKATRISK